MTALRVDNLRVRVRERGRFSRHWGKVTVVALALAAFLGWYDSVRNQGWLFICDLASVAGQSGELAVCSEDETPPDHQDLVAVLEWLKQRENQLDPEQRAQLKQLESKLEDRAFDVLAKALSAEDTPVDAQAEADTRDAVREAVEEGDPEERRAMKLIADGDVAGGLQLLEELASASSRENAAQWRRIGRLSFGIDTVRALEAYEKVAALDQSDPWDSIYLGRLYQRAGRLAEADRTYRTAIDRLPMAEERTRSVLSAAIGGVQD